MVPFPLTLRHRVSVWFQRLWVLPHARPPSTAVAHITPLSPTHIKYHHHFPPTGIYSHRSGHEKEGGGHFVSPPTTESQVQLEALWSQLKHDPSSPPQAR